MAKKKDIETCFNYCSKDEAFFSSNEQKWINRVRRLAAKFPDRVTILRQPETNDGTIYAKMPCNTMKLALSSPNPAAVERIARMNAARNNAQ